MKYALKSWNKQQDFEDWRWLSVLYSTFQKVPESDTGKKPSWHFLVTQRIACFQFAVRGSADSGCPTMEVVWFKSLYVSQLSGQWCRAIVFRSSCLSAFGKVVFD